MEMHLKIENKISLFFFSMESNEPNPPPPPSNNNATTRTGVVRGRASVETASVGANPEYAHSTKAIWELGLNRVKDISDDPRLKRHVLSESKRISDHQIEYTYKYWPRYATSQSSSPLEVFVQAPGLNLETRMTLMSIWRNWYRSLDYETQRDVVRE